MAGTCVMRPKPGNKKAAQPQPTRARRMSFADFEVYEQVRTSSLAVLARRCVDVAADQHHPINPC